MVHVHVLLHQYAPNLYSLIINNKTEKFPGLVSGCLPAYGLRLSTLECFYNETCLKRLSAFINSSYIGYPLDISKSTRFTPVSSIPIGTLIDELFIERWENKSNYSAYFSNLCTINMSIYFGRKGYSYVYVNNISMIIWWINCGIKVGHLACSFYLLENKETVY